MFACLNLSPREMHFSWLIYPCKEGTLGLWFDTYSGCIILHVSKFIVPSLIPSL
jgi:hypothetical protein